MTVLEAGAAAKARAHTVYRVADGTRVPGVTTVLGVLDKPALKAWANRIGLQGIELGAYVDELADIGKLGHALIHEHLTGTAVDRTAFSAQQLDRAETCFLKFLEWAKARTVETVLAEAALVSERYRFGGTVDWYGRLNGVPTLVDFKTARAIYDEHILQVAAYRQLVVEAGHPVEAVRILQIGREESEGFSERTVGDTAVHFELFTHALAIYRLQGRLRSQR